MSRATTKRPRTARQKLPTFEGLEVKDGRYYTKEGLKHWEVTRLLEKQGCENEGSLWDDQAGIHTIFFSFKGRTYSAEIPSALKLILERAGGRTR